MGIPGPQGKTETAPLALRMYWWGCPSLLWVTTLSFDNLTHGIIGVAGLSEGGEILLKAQEFQAYSSTPSFFCGSPAGRGLGPELSHKAVLATAC